MVMKRGEWTCLFLTGSAIGSLVETLWCRISNGFWERRTSVIYGDLSFAEGIGSVFLTFVLRKDGGAPAWKVFGKSFFWGTVLEYIMSWGEETFTGYRSWDYSKRFMNINGRVCLMYSVFWGILGLVWSKAVCPVLKTVEGFFPERVMERVARDGAALLVVDIVVSALAKNRFSARRDGKEARNKLEKWLDDFFPDERVIRAYPNSVRVGSDGTSEADTLNGTNTRALTNNSLKAKAKAWKEGARLS